MKSFKKISGVAIGIGLGLVGLGVFALANRKRVKISRSIISNVFGGDNFLTGYPRGIRNNNPGNIVLTKSEWKGEVPRSENTDGRFKQFYKYSDGLRAAILNLKAYYKKGYRTPRQITFRWAPPNENNSSEYMAYVSKHTGVPPDTPISFNKAEVKKLIEAIIIKENGKLYMSQKDFEKAWAES